MIYKYRSAIILLAKKIKAVMARGSYAVLRHFTTRGREPVPTRPPSTLNNAGQNILILRVDNHRG